MNNASIGNHSKIIAQPSDQKRIRDFYRDILGCSLTKESNEVDYIKFPGDFFLAVLYQNNVSTDESLRSSIWLELRSEQPEKLREKILEFGVTKIEIPGAAHLYFQAPGGQVFRLVRTGEDLSVFEK